MIEFQQLICGDIVPQMTCDVCFEPITDGEHALIVWHPDESIQKVYAVHHDVCLVRAMTICGRPRVGFMSMKHYLSCLMHSMGYITTLMFVLI